MKIFKKERKPLEIPLKIVWLLRWFVEIILNYSMIMSFSIYMIPMLLITLGKYMGLSYDTEIVDILVLFALPALFLVGMCIIIYCFIMKQFHRLFNELYDKIAIRYRAIDDKKSSNINDADDADMDNKKNLKRNKNNKR